MAAPVHHLKRLWIRTQNGIVLSSLSAHLHLCLNHHSSSSVAWPGKTRGFSELGLFNAELSLKRSWRGPWSQEAGQEGDCTWGYTVTASVSLIVRGKVAKTVSINHNFWKERRAETTKSNRGPSAYQSNILPLGQTDSLIHNGLATYFKQDHKHTTLAWYRLTQHIIPSQASSVKPKEYHS